MRSIHFKLRHSVFSRPALSARSLLSTAACSGPRLGRAACNCERSESHQRSEHVCIRSIDIHHLIIAMESSLKVATTTPKLCEPGHGSPFSILGRWIKIRRFLSRRRTMRPSCSTARDRCYIHSGTTPSRAARAAGRLVPAGSSNSQTENRSRSRTSTTL